MSDLINFSLDPTSFWIGIAAASILWWLAGKLKLQFPGFKNSLSKIIAYAGRRRAEGFAYHLKASMLRRAQHAHLASSLFPLDDILIPPRLVTPPTQEIPNSNPQPAPYIDQFLPYLPEFPELTANFAHTTISLSQALGNGANLLLIGQPGSGKTVALAHLTAQMARSKTNSSIENSRPEVPIFLHVLDLELPPANDNFEPINVLARALETEISVSNRHRIQPFLRKSAEEGKALLLLDGFDELSPQEARQYSAFLQKIIKEYPALQIVMTASPNFVDGILGLGFQPILLAYWNMQERQAFRDKWRNSWEKQVQPAIKGHPDLHVKDNTIIAGWLEAENKIYSPLEWTLIVWGAYDGRLTGFSVRRSLDFFIHRAAHPQTPRLALENLAYQFLSTGTTGQNGGDVEKFFSKFHPKNFLEKKPEENPSHLPVYREKSKKISSSQRSINKLLDKGLLIEHSNGRIRFSHPIFQGYLASHILENNESYEAPQSSWIIQILALQFWISVHETGGWIEDAISKENDPLFRKLLQTGRALKYAPPDLKWRSEFLKRIITLLHSSSIQMPIKIRLLAMLAQSNDPTLPPLFRRLLTSTQPEIRLMSALGLGALDDVQTINDLTRLINDPDIRVRTAACTGISSVRSARLLQLKEEILHKGTEDQKTIMAESLALQPPEGHEVLLQAISSPDILVRRAVVAGLSRVHEDWAIQRLEKIAIEDGHWVIKNAALSGVEHLKNPAIFAPQLYVPPSESPWLISFASRHGYGIPAGDPAMDMLLFALNAGSPEEKTAAIEYLKGYPNREVEQELLKVFRTGSEILQGKSYLSLCYIMASDMAHGTN
ncbi:MAG: HEAT repeat domain-containing protein [Anaerolineaceae bacterium]|nr:HEAT repeat domain-containing protein [Anaerolineaceae bacterium]